VAVLSSNRRNLKEGLDDWNRRLVAAMSVVLVGRMERLRRWWRWVRSPAWTTALRRDFVWVRAGVAVHHARLTPCDLAEGCVQVVRNHDPGFIIRWGLVVGSYRP